MFSRGKRTSAASVNVVAARNDLDHPRFGLSVSKRVGTAVTRNLVKRRLRHALADLRLADGWDVVVTAKPQASTDSFAVLENSVMRSLTRLGIQIAPDNVDENRGGR